MINQNEEEIFKIARYLILYREGGLFVNRDFECIEPFDSLIKDETFCLFVEDDKLSDSLLISEKESPFLKFIISNLIEYLDIIEYNSNSFINIMFNLYEKKHEIEIIPFENINPCTRDEIKLYSRGLLNDADLEDKLSEAHSMEGCPSISVIP